MWLVKNVYAHVFHIAIQFTWVIFPIGVENRCFDILSGSLQYGLSYEIDKRNFIIKSVRGLAVEWVGRKSCGEPVLMLDSYHFRPAAESY